MKDKKTTTVKREEGNPSCTHCKKNGHDDEHCWKLHLEKIPKRLSGKGKTNTVATVQQDLGSKSRDEGKITMAGVQGKEYLHASSSSSDESHIDE